METLRLDRGLFGWIVGLRRYGFVVGSPQMVIHQIGKIRKYVVMFNFRKSFKKTRSPRLTFHLKVSYLLKIISLSFPRQLTQFSWFFLWRSVGAAQDRFEINLHWKYPLDFLQIDFRYHIPLWNNLHARIGVEVFLFVFIFSFDS